MFFNVSLAFSLVQKCVHKYKGGSGTTKLKGHNTAECDYVLRCPDFHNVCFNIPMSKRGSDCSLTSQNWSGHSVKRKTAQVLI